MHVIINRQSVSQRLQTSAEIKILMILKPLVHLVLHSLVKIEVGSLGKFHWR